MREDLTSPEGFEALVLEHQTAVFRTLTRLTGSGAHVEDLAQEVFLRLYRALPNFRGQAAISTYLYRITFNVAQDEWKRRRRERTHIAETPAQDEDETSWVESLPGDTLQEHARNPEQLMADAQMQQAVESALRGLSDVERAVLVLYHQEECSYEGIAAALELPINTVRTHLHRGRKKLAETIQTTVPAVAPRHHNDMSTQVPAVAGRRL
jgi:RNA polymerase sigma-70 factor (ECF subfamily)